MTPLVQALIARQDALSRRTARRIAAILETHVDRAAVEASWRAECRRARRVLTPIPDRFLAQRPQADHELVRRTLGRLVAEAIDELGDDGQPLDPTASNGVPDVPPRPRRSRSLASARGQNAQLQADWLDLKARIVPYPHPRRPR